MSISNSNSNCSNVNDHTCMFLIQLGSKCDSLSYVNEVPFSEYCCEWCKDPKTFELVSESLQTTASCINMDNDTCEFYLNQGVQCNSISYIDTVPFYSFCCQSCNAVPQPPININSTNGTSGQCRNTNTDTCLFYLNKGARCDQLSYINNVPFHEYCCEFCGDSNPDANATTTVSPFANWNTSTTCINYNNESCNFYFENLGVSCDTISYINNVPIQYYWFVLVLCFFNF
jgi:hypothetical protein